MITIVDYGMGNIGSIINMLKKIGVTATSASSVEEIKKSKKLILPGVGAFDAAVTKINELGILDILNTKATKEKIPILGICLGMQLLTDGSDEGKLPGLSWIPGRTLSFKKVLDTQKHKVPHMGWNKVKKNTTSELTTNLNDEETRFYFVHSYYVKCTNNHNSILKTEYGIEFDSAIQNDNIYGAQFHPEKSHKYGMRLLENFVKIT